MLKNIPVFVTGAGGFIGSHLVERLVREQARVTAFHHYNSRGDWGLLEQLPANILREVRVVQGDIRDAATLMTAVRGHEIVFHLAALIGIPYSYVAPDAYVATNVQGTLNMLEAARAAGVRRFIHTSTSEVYGTARYVPIDEKHPLQGQSPYSATKIAADKLVESYICSFEFPASVLRSFNNFGPRQSARAVIPTIISQALFADKIKLGSVSPVRDFTFVEDTADAFIKLALTELRVLEPVNIGNGAGISIGELAQRIVTLVGHDIPIVEDASRIRPSRSEVETLIADASRAKQLLGWTPMVSLSEGLTRTITFIKDYPHLYRIGQYAV
jgi:NAD dependent epimerase/dehydratase